jgi:predicted phosphodiesterase
MLETTEITYTKCNVGDKQNAKLVLISDPHIGSATFREDLLDHAIDYIKNNRYTYWVCLGDIMEVGTRNSPGTSLFDMRMRNEEQFEYALDKFSPIRKKCLGLHRGNHDMRVDRSIGFNMIRYIARDLGTEYLNDTAYHIMDINGKEWKIFTTHGKSGATTLRGKETAIKRLKENHEEADIYCMGHVHKLGYLEDDRFAVGIDPETRRQTIKIISNGHFLFSGHFMGYIGSYAQQMLLTPEPAGYPILTFRPNETLDVQLVWEHEI